MQQREWLRRVGGQCWAGRWRSRARAVLKEWRWEVQRSPGPVLRGLGKEGNDPNVLDDLYIQPACSPCTQSPERLFNQQRGMGPNGLKLLSARFIRLEAEEEGEDTTATKEKANEILCAGEKSGLNGVEEDHFDAESISGPPLPVAELEDRPTACDSPILPTPLRPRSEAWTPASMPLLRRSQLGEATNESPERGGGDFQAWRSSEVTAWLSGSNQEAATAPGNEYSRGAADAFKVVDMDVSGMRNVSTGLNLGENGKKGEQEELEPVLGVCKQDLQGFTRVVSKSRQASSKETRSPETGSNRARVRRWLECFVDSQSNFAAKRELFEGSVLSSTERGLQWIGEEGVADEYSDVGEAKHGVQDDAQCGEVPNDINMTEISKVTVGPATIGMPITEVFRGTYDELPELQMSKRNLLPSNWVLGSLDTQMFEVDEEESISSSMYDSRSKRDQTYDFRDMRAISVAGGQSEGSLWWESALEREADEMLRRAMFQWRRVREKGLWLKWEEERIVVCEEAWILAAVVKVWTQIVQKRRDNAFVLSESEKKQASLTADKGNNVDIVTNNVAEPGVQNRELVKALENRVVEVVQLHGELEQAMSRVEMEVKRRMALEIDCGMEVMRREELESKLAKLEKLLAEAREVREGESMEIEKTAEKLVGLLGGEEWEGNDGKVEKSEAWTLTETWDDGDVDRTSLEIANESMQKSVAVLEAELMRFRALQQQELEQKSWTVRWVETSTMTDGGNELDVLGNWRERTEIRDATTMTDEAETASLTPLIAPEMVKGIAITDALRVEETKAMEHESVMTMTDWSWMGMVEIPGMAEWDRMDEGDSMNLMTEILGDCEGADLIRGGSTLVRASESVEQRRADEALETRLQGCEDVMADEVGEMRGLLVGLKEQVMGSTVQLHDTLQVPLSPSEPSVLPHRQTRALVLGNDALDCCASPDGQRLKRCDANAVGQKARPANLSPGLAPVANHEIPGHVEGMVSSTEGGPGHGSVLSPDLRQGPKAEPGHHSPNSPPGPFVVWVEWLARPAQLRRLRAVWAKWELATFPVEPAEFPGVAQETAHSLGRATRGGSGIAETRPIGDVVTELGAGLARRSPCGALAVEEHAGPRGPVPPLRLKCPRPPADSSGARIGQQGGNEGEPVVRLARAPFKRGRRWGAGQAPLEQVHKNE